MQQDDGSPIGSEDPSPQACGAAPISLDIQFFGDAAAGHAAPMEFVSGRILFRAEIVGREVWGLLDNGAERSLIDARLAQAAKLEIGAPEGSVHTPLGAIPKRRVASVPIVIPGQFRTRMPALAAADLRPMFAVFDREVAFVLGAELLEQLAVFVDVDKNKLRIGPSGVAKFSGRHAEIALCDGQAHVAVTIEGTSLTAKVALGYEGTVRVSPHAWARVRPDEHLDPVSPALAGRVHLSGTALASTLELGPIRASEVNVQIAPLGTDGVDALVGMGVLRRMPFIVDVKQGRLWVAPPRPRPEEIH